MVIPNLKNQMKNIIKNKKFTGIFILIIGMGIIYYSYSYIHRSKASLANINSTALADASAKKIIPTVSQNINESSATVGMEMEYAADFSNNRVLMGASHNVFVGKIIKQVGDKERGIGPETQFEVQIVFNIKGNLQGGVTVDQEGGYKNGILYYVQSGAPLLIPGATYLLATRYSSQEKWYTLNPSLSGSQFIINDSNLSIDQLKTLARNDIRVKQLEAAYPNEILLDADIKNNNALNSYQSLYGGPTVSSSS